MFFRYSSISESRNFNITPIKTTDAIQSYNFFTDRLLLLLGGVVVVVVVVCDYFHIYMSIYHGTDACIIRLAFTQKRLMMETEKCLRPVEHHVHAAFLCIQFRSKVKSSLLNKSIFISVWCVIKFGNTLGVVLFTWNACCRRVILYKYKC